MNKIRLISQFQKNHQEFIDYIGTLSDDQFVFSQNGKWTPGQQLNHLCICLKPLVQVLASKEFIREKFGMADHKSVSYEEMVEKYNSLLEAGGKAPEKFLPPTVTLQEKSPLCQELFSEVQMINVLLNGYSDEELNSLLLPHPLAGKITIMEMFYIMAYHATHHLLQTKRNLVVSK